MKKLILISLIILLSAGGSATAETEYFWIKGYKYYPLYEICQQKDIEYSWDSIGRIATLSKNGIEAKIRIGSDKILIDGKRLKDIGPPLYFYKETVVIPSSFAKKDIDDIFKYRAGSIVYEKRRKRALPIQVHSIKTIVLDPGHGGKDPGAIGRYYRLKEKDINLDIAKRLKMILSSYGIRVYLTRQKDYFIPLDKRAEFANSKNTDLFISIHTNSSRSKWLNGFEAYYLSEKTDDNARAEEAAKGSLKLKKGFLDKYNTTAKAIAYDLKFTEDRKEARELAEHLIKAIKKKNIYARKNALKSARFHVLKNIKTDMPAVIVEIGYISNKKEEDLIRLSSYRDKIAEGLAKGILSYKDEFEKTNGFTR